MPEVNEVKDEIERLRLEITSPSGKTAGYAYSLTSTASRGNKSRLSNRRLEDDNFVF